VNTMSAEKFCLRWNDFESNISSAFRDLKGDKDFFDVSIVCEGEGVIEAHKVILAACSPLFKSILRRMGSSMQNRMFLYLKGVKAVEMEAVMNFMYFGEVNVAQQDLNSFLAVAEELKIKGLTHNNSAKASQGFQTRAASPGPGSSRSSQSLPARKPKQTYTADSEEIQEVAPVAPVLVKAEPGGGAGGVEQPGQLEAYYDEEGFGGEAEVGPGYEDYGGVAGHTIDTDAYKGNVHIETPEDFNQFVERNSSGVSCSICHSFSHKSVSSVRIHIESKHFPNSFTYNCPLCEMTFGTKKSLENHNFRQHKQARI